MVSVLNDMPVTKTTLKSERMKINKNSIIFSLLNEEVVS